MNLKSININGFLKKGFLWIPIIIIGCIFIGYLINISQYGWSGFSFQDSRFFSFSNSIWWLEILPLVVILYSVALLINQSRSTKRYRHQFPKSTYNGPIKYLKLPKRYFVPQLAYFMLLLWGIGWGLYMLAIWSNYEGNDNLAEIIGYSAMSSLDLFLMDINGNILDSIGETVKSINGSILKGGIVLTAILSAACSFSLIIKIFLHSLFTNLHTSSIKISEKTSHLYIFFGINEKSISLSNSIKNQTGDPQSLIIFIEESSDSDENTDGLQNIIDLISPSSSKKTVIDLDDKTIHLISATNLTGCNPCKDIWVTLGLEYIDKLISKLYGFQNPQIHLFLLSEDRDRNISDAKIMRDSFVKISLADEDFKRITKSIYLQGRRESVTAIIEDKNIDIENNINIKLIDDSNLAIDQLKKDVKYHPINFVEIDGLGNPGTVRSTFTSLIIGFGETGRDALRYLYEFSSFVNYTNTEIPDKNDTRYIRSPFECHIVDKSINDIKDHFIVNAPSVFNKDGRKQISDRNTIQFHNCSDNSEEFYQLLDSISSKLNYIIVCAGDDESNISIAVRVLKFIIRERGIDPHFKILVRAYDKGLFSHLKGIEKYYRDLYDNPFAEIFGSIEQIYTYESIIVDKSIKEAEDYHNLYSSVADENYPPMDGETYWSTLIKSLDYGFYLKALEHINEIKAQNGKSRKDPLSKSESLIDVRRQIKENCKNSLHAPTKIYLLQKVINEFNNANPDLVPLTIETILNVITNSHSNWGERLNVLSSEIDIDNIPIKTSNFIKRLIINLCRTEHIRWNSSHELQGFRFDDSIDKNFTRMTHQCLVDWEDLPKIDPYALRYDYLVVETSLRLHLKDIQNNNKSSSNHN